MINVSNITPGFNQRVLVSINALIDIDVGLYYLIKEQYLDPEVFNVDLLNNSNIIDFINLAYNRKDDNPLYAISSINDKALLDEYYTEFMKTQYNNIYDRSTYTDVYKMIEMFLTSSNDIRVSILYYSDYAKEQLMKDQEEGKLNKSIGFVSIKELRNLVDNFNEFYFRSIYEFDNINISSLKSPKTFYISTFSRNYDTQNRLIKLDSIEKIMTGKLMNEIYQFSMYNINMIRKEETKGES